MHASIGALHHPRRKGLLGATGHTFFSHAIIQTLQPPQRVEARPKDQPLFTVGGSQNGLPMEKLDAWALCSFFGP